MPIPIATFNFLLNRSVASDLVKAYAAAPAQWICTLPEDQDFSGIAKVRAEISSMQGDLLAAVEVTDPGAVDSVTLDWTAAQMAQEVPVGAVKDFRFVIAAVYTSGTVPDYFRSGKLRLTYNNYSGGSLEPPDPLSDFARQDELDELTERVEDLEEGGGGGGGGGVTSHSELTGRDAADSHPQLAITGLVAALAAKASATDLTNEATTRATADTAEATARAAADTSLNTAITAEATARAAADTAINAALDDKADLDIDGKVTLSQLPESVVGALNYQGTWNAATNTPTLADGTGSKGLYYVVATGGTVNLGSGSLTFASGDWVVHNGTKWDKLDATDQVSSVAGKTGVVTLSAEDITGLSGTVADDIATLVGNDDTLNNAVAARLVAANNLSDIPAPSTAKAHLDLDNVPNYGVASQAEAEAGTATNKLMTPQRTAQAIAALGSGASQRLWRKALASDGVSSSTSLADLLTLSIPEAGDYTFEAVLAFQANTTTEGIGLGINGSGLSAIAFNVEAMTAAGSWTGAHKTVVEDPLVTTAGLTTPILAKLFGKFTASGSATLAIRFKAETGGANSVTVKAGSLLTLAKAD